MRKLAVLFVVLSALLLIFGCSSAGSLHQTLLDQEYQRAVSLHNQGLSEHTIYRSDGTIEVVIQPIQR